MTEHIENNEPLQEENSINLAGAVDSPLIELKLKHNICASASFLRDVGVCLSAEKIPATEEILKFFDAIYLSATSLFENTDVAVISEGEGEVKRTLRDLVTKYNYLHDTDAHKLPFEDFIHLPSKYLSTLDVCPPSTVCVSDNGCGLSFTDECGNTMLSLALDDCPLPFGYKKAAQSTKASTIPAQNGDLFFLLTLDNCEKDYKVQKNELFKNLEFANAVKTSTTLGCGGLLYALSQLTLGAVIYGDAVGADDNLSNLVTLNEGKSLISISPENEETVKNLAKEYSLCARKVAEASDLLSYSIFAADRKINIRANFLRGLFKYRATVNEQIPVEEFSLSKYEKLYVTKDGQTEEAPRVLSFKGHLTSTLKTSSCSFTSAINIVLDCVFALLAKGVSREDIGISLKIGCNKNHKEDALSALLGVYRVCVELSISEKDSTVVDSEQSYIFCCAYAKEKKIQRPNHAPDEPSLAYLLSFGRFNDTIPRLMPDFSAVRKMCILLEDAFSHELVIDAKAVDGFVTPAANELCTPPLSLSPYFDDGINADTRAQGIILQVPISKKIKAPLIGVIRKG